MAFFSVRLHENDRVSRESVEAHFSNASYYPGLLFIVRETAANRVHYQGIVWVTVGEFALRKRVRTAFSVTGNAEYSVGKVDDVERSKRYYAKGVDADNGPDVVLSRQLSDIDALHVQYWEENRQLKSRQKTAKLGMIESIAADVGAVGHLPTEDLRALVTHKVVGELVRRNVGINVYNVRSIVNAVCIRVDNEFFNLFVAEVLEKM